MSKLLLHLAIMGSLFSCGSTNTKPSSEDRADLKKHYDSIAATGCFILFDPAENKYTYYNREISNNRVTPASTFKIPNTMIGLETGVIQDENFVIKWDSTVRSNPLWNADHDLKTAYQHSCVWYYQELAKRVGPAKMKYWLDKINYGNKDTAGGAIWFWLSGKLGISPQEQIDFLQKLYENKLPFSARTMGVTKRIMLQDSTANYEVRAKTGWGGNGDSSVGWYVGWVETKGKVYYFANLLLLNEDYTPEKAGQRKTIAYKILRELKVL